MTAALARLCAQTPGRSGVQLLDDGPAALAVRLALVRRARVSIDVQYYILRDDVAGRLLLDELVLAAARGLTVRLLLDDFGTKGMDAKLAALPGVAVRLFNPARLRWPRWANALFDFARFNRRMHNKSLTVDGVATVIGGRNIGDEYFDAENPALAADLDVLAIGAIAGAVGRDFQGFWDSAAAVPVDRVVRRAAGAPVPATPGRLRDVYLAAVDSAATKALIDETTDFVWAEVRMLSDPPDKIFGAAAEAALLLPQLLAALAPIRRRLFIVSAYFVPTSDSASLLGGLAAQGADVAVLTNSLISNDVALVHAWYAPWRRRLLQAGIRLWEMRGRADDRAILGLVPRRLRRTRDDTSFFRASASALHAKTVVADKRWLFVGSMNFDARSFQLNTELGFLIDSPDLAARVQATLDATLPGFAWAVEEEGGALAWREEERLLHVEPGTNPFQRAIFRLLGRLPLGRFF